VEAEREVRGHAEVSAAAMQRPEQLGIFTFTADVPQALVTTAAKGARAARARKERRDDWNCFIASPSVIAWVSIPRHSLREQLEMFRIRDLGHGLN
jgi:hypothetical protein